MPSGAAEYVALPVARRCGVTATWPSSVDPAPPRTPAQAPARRCRIAQSARHLRRTRRLANHEPAQRLGLSSQTVLNIEREVSEGTVASVNALFGLLGLKLGVVCTQDPHPLQQ